jgi:hypothetical protein
MNAPCSRTASIRQTGGQCLFAQPGGFRSDVGVAGGVAARDLRAFSNEEHWWSVIFEQMKVGRL